MTIFNVSVVNRVLFNIGIFHVYDIKVTKDSTYLWVW